MEERLQKIIAKSGVASRRAAEKMITEGRVSVNGCIVSVLGAKADGEKDEIRLDGKLLLCSLSKIYLMLNKPKGYVTTLVDPENRPTIKDLLTGIEKVYPIGRLDYDSEGLLLMTNDGDFAQRIQHPRFRISKTYRVKVKGHLTKEEVTKLQKGILLSDGLFKSRNIELGKKNKLSTWLDITITEGRNRIIRRACDALGHPVSRLIRVAISDVYLGDLQQGCHRELTRKEIEKLTFLVR